MELESSERGDGRTMPPVTEKSEGAGADSSVLAPTSIPSSAPAIAHSQMHSPPDSAAPAVQSSSTASTHDHLVPPVSHLAPAQPSRRVAAGATTAQPDGTAVTQSDGAAAMRREVTESTKRGGAMSTQPNHSAVNQQNCLAPSRAAEASTKEREVTHPHGQMEKAARLERALAAQEEELIYLRKSEARHRDEMQELVAALGIKVPDKALINECEDLRAAARLRGLELAFAKSTAEVHRTESVALRKKLEAVLGDSGTKLSILEGVLKAERDGAKISATKAAKAELEHREARKGLERREAALNEKVEALKQKIGALNQGKKDADLSLKDLSTQLRALQKKLETRDANNVKIAALLEAEKTALKQAVKERNSLAEDYKRAEKEVAEQTANARDARADLAEARAKLQKLEETTKSFTLPPSSLPQASRGALISPAPLFRGHNGRLHSADDEASESRSRFTDTLPLQLGDDDDSGGGTNKRLTNKLPLRRRGDDDIGEVGNEEDLGKQSKARPGLMRTSPRLPNTRPKKASKARKRPAQNVEEPPINAAQLVSTAIGASTQKGRGVAGRTHTKPPAKRRRAESKEQGAGVSGKPSRKRKVPDDGDALSSVDVKPVERKTEGRKLRNRKPVSYDYDQAGRDIVNPSPGYEVDPEALRIRPASRIWRSPVRPSSVRPSSMVKDVRQDDEVAPVAGKRMKRERIRAVRKSTR